MSHSAVVCTLEDVFFKIILDQSAGLWKSPALSSRWQTNELRAITRDTSITAPNSVKVIITTMNKKNLLYTSCPSDTDQNGQPHTQMKHMVLRQRMGQENKLLKVAKFWSGLKIFNSQIRMYTILLCTITFEKFSIDNWNKLLYYWCESLLLWVFLIPCSFSFHFFCIFIFLVCLLICCVLFPGAIIML